MTTTADNNWLKFSLDLVEFFVAETARQRRASTWLLDTADYFRYYSAVLYSIVVRSLASLEI